jgi:hypothetical protein
MSIHEERHVEPFALLRRGDCRCCKAWRRERLDGRAFVPRVLTCVQINRIDGVDAVRTPPARESSIVSIDAMREPVLALGPERGVVLPPHAAHLLLQIVGAPFRLVDRYAALRHDGACSLVCLVYVRCSPFAAVSRCVAPTWGRGGPERCPSH